MLFSGDSLVLTKRGVVNVREAIAKRQLAGEFFDDLPAIKLYMNKETIYSTLFLNDEVFSKGHKNSVKASKLLNNSFVEQGLVLFSGNKNFDCDVYEVYLLGLLMGDGHVKPRKDRNGPTIGRHMKVSYINFVLTMKRNSRVKKYLKKFDKNLIFRKHGDNAERAIFSVVFSNYLARKYSLTPGAGALYKTLNTTLFNLPYMCRLAFIGGMLDSDGSIAVENNSVRVDFSTSSTELSDRLQKLLTLQKFGLQASYRIVKGGSYGRRVDTVRLSISKVYSKLVIEKLKNQNLSVKAEAIPNIVSRNNSVHLDKKYYFKVDFSRIVFSDFYLIPDEELVILDGGKVWVDGIFVRHQNQEAGLK